MGLHQKIGKSPKKLDMEKAPPVFSQHGDEELKKSSKGHTTSNLVSSQKIWIATSNLEAKKKQQQQSENRRSSMSSYGSYTEEVLEEVSYYDEEIIDDDEADADSPYNLPPRKTTIRFDEFDEMQTVLHINDYTGQEIKKSWYKREDYDRMVLLARKTAEIVEERRKLRKNDKKLKPIESRGLEAWTQTGAMKVKVLKDRSVETVWNEQNRQWEAGTYEADKIREVYIKISKSSQASAEDRAFSDELIAKGIREKDMAKQAEKRKRKLLGKSRALVKKTAKVTTDGVMKTTKLVGKTTKMTGKVALETTKRTMKAGVATATLDGRMLKEAVTIKTKKREVEKQTVRRPSQSSMGAIKLATSNGKNDDDDLLEDESALTENGTRKNEKLKLLGLVPIPGTKRQYEEDRRQKKIEKRQGLTRKASWEAGLAASGKY